MLHTQNGVTGDELWHDEQGHLNLGIGDLAEITTSRSRVWAAREPRRRRISLDPHRRRQGWRRELRSEEELAGSGRRRPRPDGGEIRRRLGSRAAQTLDLEVVISSKSPSFPVSNAHVHHVVIHHPWLCFARVAYQNVRIRKHIISSHCIILI